MRLMTRSKLKVKRLEVILIAGLSFAVRTETVEAGAKAEFRLNRLQRRNHLFWKRSKCRDFEKGFLEIKLN
jgi:hypothetical protein